MKRFYRDASARQVEGGWQVYLDDRPLKTQGGAAQVVPTRALADMLASEWAEQGEEIDPTAFRFRDMVDYALDRGASERAAMTDALLRFAETDTLCYRADPEDALFARQDEVWEPLLAAMEAREGIRMTRISGIMHQPQDEAALAALRSRIDGMDVLALAALEQTTSLAASLCIGLAALAPDADGEALWDAANLEEDWQADLWGQDWEAQERRDKRKAAFLAAMDFARAAADRQPG